MRSAGFRFFVAALLSLGLGACVEPDSRPDAETPAPPHPQAAHRPDSAAPAADAAHARNAATAPHSTATAPTIGGLPVGVEGYRAPHAVALLLPLDGPLKAVAQPIRDGVFAAYFADAHQPRPELRIYDSGDSADAAVAAYRRAVADGADRVIGPLRRDAVSAVLAQASLPVPVLALNQPERGETAPPGSATFGLSPETEGAQAAQHMLERGITQAAIIAASADWAERAAGAFRTQFEAAHGVIVGEARLRDGEVNFAAGIRQALALDKDAAGSGLFISMLPQQARLLLPQIKIAGYAALPVFATSHVFDGVANPGFDRDLDGVEFCDAPWLFDATTDLPRYADVSATLDSARGAGARLFAMGLDAWALAPYLDWLGRHRDATLPGATGLLSLDAAGRVQRTLVWARFADGIAAPLDGQPSP